MATAATALASDTDVAVATEKPRRTIKRTTPEQAVAFIAAVESGMQPRQAATEHGLNIRTAYDVLARADANLDALRAATRKVMAAATIDRLEDWRIASDVGARKKGNHAPAKDWLLHAGVIDALDSDTANVRIAINIGTDEKPMRIPSPMRQIDEE